eukprot:Pgem_evm1s1844
MPMPASNRRLLSFEKRLRHSLSVDDVTNGIEFRQLTLPQCSVIEKVGAHDVSEATVAIRTCNSPCQSILAMDCENESSNYLDMN